MTDAELKKLAEDVWAGKVFTDCHIETDNQEEFADMCLMIFMPLALMKEDQMEMFKASKPGMMYEYITEACERSVNGYPRFYSFRYIKEDELPKFEQYYMEAQG